MRTLSPIRSTSPISRPKITFNYPPSPLRERPSNLPIASPLSSKNQEKLSIQSNTAKTMKVSSEFQHCIHCAKMATYRSTNSGNKFCSGCAINEMRNGVEVVRIELKEQNFYKDYQQKFEKENHQNSTNRLSSRSHSFELKDNTKSSNENHRSQLIQLTKETKELKVQMKGMLEQLQKKDFSSEGIKNIYREKKMGLKKHYEKIKEAIKASIQKDLQELEKRQQRSLQCLEDVKDDLQKGINSLDGLHHESDANHLNHEPYTEQNMTTTKNCVEGAVQKRNRAALIVNQLSAYEQGSDSQSDSLNVRKTQQQLQEVKKQLYDPHNYALLDGKNREGETLFSFQHKFK